VFVRPTRGESIACDCWVLSAIGRVGKERYQAGRQRAGGNVAAAAFACTTGMTIVAFSVTDSTNNRHGMEKLSRKIFSTTEGKKKNGKKKDNI
jgi:hypothetical protein